MKKASLENTRAFFTSLVGKDKPFKSRSRLAEYLGMKEPAMQTKFFKFLKGADSSYGNVMAWLEKLGGMIVLPEDNVEEIAHYSFIPKVAAIAGAGASLETSDAIKGYYAFRTDWLGMEHISDSNSVLMDVRGDSMEPLLKDGDTLLIDQTDREILDGRIYVVTLGDELRVKRVFKGLNGLILRSENKLYPDVQVQGSDLDGFQIHGRVRWCGKLL